MKANFGFYSNLYSSAVIISLKELSFYKVEIELESRLEWQFVIYYEKILFKIPTLLLFHLIRCEFIKRHTL